MKPTDSAPFSHVVLVRDIGRKGRREKLEADAAQKAALADLLGVEAVERLAGEFNINMVGGGAVQLRGRIEADVVQTCVVSLEPVRQHIDEKISIALLPAASADARPEREVLVDPLDEEDLDTFANGRIDLGVIVSEQLALCLDPYPRAPGAEFKAAAKEKPAKPDSPFTALARLKRKRR